MNPSPNVLELFCGIGGVAACVRDSNNISIDINRNALEVHRLNFSSRILCRTIESLTRDEVSGFECDSWWMSPPCQPFTRRGLGNDLDDPRSAGFKNVIGLLEQLRPTNVALENVEEFRGSRSHQLIEKVLVDLGYRVAWSVICSTDFGLPNRRRRFFLIASKDALIDWLPFPEIQHRLRLEVQPDNARYAVPEDWLHRYRNAMRIVTWDQLISGEATTNCFTSAYGRSPVRSGSYLQTSTGIRFFTPLEVLFQLGFPQEFQLPDLPTRQLWALAGNSLSVPAVNYVLDHLPGWPPCVSKLR